MGVRKYETGVADDPFTFMIEEVDRITGKRTEVLGGANNAVAAKAAYLVYADEYRGRRIQLRSRARIINESAPRQ